MRMMKRWLIRLGCGCAAVLLRPLEVLAQDERRLNAKVEGYKVPVKVDEASTTLIWLVMILFTAIAVAVLFKNAKRTHLD